MLKRWWSTLQHTRPLFRHINAPIRIMSSSAPAPSAAPASSPSWPIPYTLPLPGGIPDTHRPHTEAKTTILVPKDNIAFLNPVQEYNRDLSVAVIRAWNEMRKEEAEGKW